MTPETLSLIQTRAYRDIAPWSAADFTSLISQDSVHLFTAPQGFLLLRLVLDEAEILALAIDPEAQGKGHGSDLMTQMHQKIASQGVVHVFLEVAETNAGAQRFYERHGYAKTGKREGYYRLPDGSRIDAVLMSRALSQ